MPALREVAYTNFCRIAVREDRAAGLVKVFSVIDNLVKGASGQAVQNMNCMFGLPEDDRPGEEGMKAMTASRLPIVVTAPLRVAVLRPAARRPSGRARRRDHRVSRFPKGFLAGGVAVGLKQSGKPDMGVLCCGARSSGRRPSRRASSRPTRSRRRR